MNRLGPSEAELVERVAEALFRVDNPRMDEWELPWPKCASDSQQFIHRRRASAAMVAVRRHVAAQAIREAALAYYAARNEIASPSFLRAEEFLLRRADEIEFTELETS